MIYFISFFSNFFSIKTLIIFTSIHLYYSKYILIVLCYRIVIYLKSLLRFIQLLFKADLFFFNILNII